MGGRCGILLGVVVLLGLGCAPVAWAQAANSLVSINSAGTDSGNGTSGQVSIFADIYMTASADGRFVVFESTASDLVANDTNGAVTDVFLRDRMTGTTTLVSINSAGTGSGNVHSFDPVISANGRFVAFLSQATDLVTLTDLNPIDVFVRDTCFGAVACTPSTQLVSINSAGTAAGNAESGGASTSERLQVSADGTRIVFVSGATDLVAGFVDGNGAGGNDVFLRDLSLATTTLVSVNSAGTASGDGGSFLASLSTDGNRVALASLATDLATTTDTNSALDVFVRDLAMSATTLVSINAAGTATGNGSSSGPVISANGNRVVFVSGATDLVSGLTDSNGLSDVFVRDLSAGTTTLVSINSAGTGAGNSESSVPSLSDDGSRIAFASLATDLHPLDTGVTSDVYLRNLPNATTTLISINSAGTAGAGSSFTAEIGGFGISGDGSRVVFSSSASGLVATPATTTTNIYVRDTLAGSTTLASISDNGMADGDSVSFSPLISTDGSLIAYSSVASNLVTTDTNAVTDVFAFPLALPEISISDATITEGNAGTSVATFTVTLSAASASTVTVDFITNAVSATSGTDFVAGSGTVTFVPTDISEPVTVTINGDASVEANETFTVDLSNPSNATLLDAQGVGTILNDDGLTISINDVTVTEGNAGTVVATFTASLSATSVSTVTVDFMTLGVTATAGTDFVTGSGTVTFMPSDVSEPVTVTVNGDTVDEPNETFVVNLSNASGATILDGQGVGTIADDDALPLGTTTSSLVSVNLGETDSGNDSSGMLTAGLRHETNTSADGRFVAFVSQATDLTSIADTNSVNDVFVRDRLLGTTTLVSVNLAGTDTGNSASTQPFISPDGTKVAFVSDASDLTAVSDVNGVLDVFVRDLVAGTTTLVSIRHSSFGAPQAGSTTSNLSNCSSGFPDRTGYRVWSDDGSKLLFFSFATNLTTVVGISGCNIYMRDLTLGATTFVNADTGGGPSNGTVDDGLFLSGDGTKAAFHSNSTDLVSGITDSLFAGNDIFVRDLMAGTTQIITVDTSGTTAVGNVLADNCFLSSFSADGNLVVFTCQAAATEMIAGITDFNGSGAAGKDVFVHNLTTSVTSLVSRNSAGTGTGNDLSEDGIISPDGSRIAFRSQATDLVAGITDGNGFDDLMLRDLSAGTTSYATINSAGTAACTGPFFANSSNHWAIFSDDGSRLAFQSGCTNLVSIPTVSTVGQVYTRDLPAGPTVLQSINAAGTNGGNASADIPFISGDGGTVVFVTVANNLGTTDTNATFDVYAKPLVAPTISINDVTVTETNAGTTIATFTVSLSAASLATVTVNFLTADNTATLADSDYVTNTGTVTFIPGDTSETVTVTINGDTNLEPNETFFVNLSMAANGILGDLQGVGTISNDDGATISIDDVSVTEGNAGTVNATFTVSLSAASASTVTVDFMTNGVTATSGTDFAPGTGTVTFVPTDVSEPVTIVVNGDTLDELNETFTVDLSNPMNATILDSQGLGTITDDDPVPTLSISDVTVVEGNSGTSNASFTVSLSAASGLPVSVDFTTLDGSAAQPGDYTLTTGTLMIPPMTATAPILVPIVGDTSMEPDETFTVSLSLPLNATIADGSGTGTITDDDSQDFTLTTVECCFECVAGFSASFNLTITPTLDPVTSPVSLSCSGLPPLSTCTFTPSSVTPGSSPATTVMVVQTTGPAGSPSASLRPSSPAYAAWLGGAGMGLAAMLLMGRGGRRRKLRAGLGATLALAAFSLAGMSCAFSGPRTPAGTYSITVTATGASFTRNLQVTLIVRD